jgi:hypothetical protein
MTNPQIVDELRDQILKLRFPHRVQNIKEVTPKTKRKLPGQPSPSKSPSLPVPKLALSDRPCVVVLNKPLERLLIRCLHVMVAWSSCTLRPKADKKLFLERALLNKFNIICNSKYINMLII